MRAVDCPREAPLPVAHSFPRIRSVARSWFLVAHSFPRMRSVAHSWFLVAHSSSRSCSVAHLWFLVAHWLWWIECATSGWVASGTIVGFRRHTFGFWWHTPWFVFTGVLLVAHSQLLVAHFVVRVH